MDAVTKQDPWSFPPGPDRRRLMTEQGWNISPADFTAEELAASTKRAAALLADVAASHV